MKRYSLFIVAFSFVLSACSGGQPEATSSVPILTEDLGQLIDVATVTPTRIPVPAVILDQLPKLQAAGLRIEQNDEGWALINHTGDASVRATEAPDMISIIDETGAILEYSADRYELREMNVVGLDSIQLMKDAQGNVERFYLEEEDVWVTPIEQFGDFARLKEDINLCPRIENEDVWRGRWLRSVALADTEPMPENVKLPDNMIYYLTSTPTGYYILLQDVVDGLLDASGHINLGINQENDYRKYLSCALTQNESGEEMLLGTERVFTPDGKRLYLTYGWGQEWSTDGSWADDIPYGSHLYNIVDSVLLARDVPKVSGHESVMLRPLISWNFDNPPHDEWYGVVEGEYAAGGELYKNPINNPENMIPNFEQIPLVRGQIKEAGPEIAKLQRMIVMSTWIGQIIPSGYFTSSP